MALAYQSPGVYFEEVPTGAPIAGVGTSTAGFIGLALRDEPRDNEDAPPPYAPPYGRPILITNLSEYVEAFGAIVPSIVTPGNILGHAVRGFFLNGGTRCWVIGLADLAAGNSDPVLAALDAFAAIDEIAIVAVPHKIVGIDNGRSKAIKQHVLNHCELLGDRFAVLDGAPVEPSSVAAILDGLCSQFGALYYPWIQVAPQRDDNAAVHAPPSGHIAGIYARVDSARGVHKAPANEVVRGALGLEFPMSRSRQDGLNPQGVNVIREFDGTLKVWGARTLEPAGEFRYINARRLFNFLRESIDEGIQWAVFEPNNPDLWARITRNVSAFLTNVWSAGALFGDTPQQAFYVKCDTETNPKSRRDNGEVITEIGVAIVKPAEFVIFRISQKTDA